MTTTIVQWPHCECTIVVVITVRSRVLLFSHVPSELKGVVLRALLHMPKAEVATLPKCMIGDFFFGITWTSLNPQNARSVAKNRCVPICLF